MTYPVSPTQFAENPYDWSWYGRDFFYSPDGTMEFPNHHCKITWIASVPFIKSFRNAIDVGCRDGEYARYLHKDFNHVFCFDYRLRKKTFHKNVDLKKITHFNCVLGNEHTTVKVSGRSNIKSGRTPEEQWPSVQQYTLDEFNFPNIDYIKIDTDGYECNILGGAKATIQRYQPLLVMEQENGDTRAITYCENNFNYKILAWDSLNRNVVMGPKD